MAIIERIVTVYNDKGSKQAVKDLNKLEKNFADAGKKIAKRSQWQPQPQVP